MTAEATDQLGGCANDDLLVAEPLDAAVRAHLDVCPRCRIQKRMLGRYADDDEARLPTGASAGLGRAEPLVRFLSRPSRTTAEPDRRRPPRQLLGQGPRGLTFAEFDPRADRHVAVKELDAIDRERLTAVAAALARANHPNLVPYVELGEGPHAEVRRRLVEQSFAEAANGARRARLLQWLGRIASALTTLHGAGVAHGGLCPENVRIQHGQVYVVDAGLGGLPADSRWRAPELADGEHSPAGDWYALGRMLVEHAPQLTQGPQDHAFDVPSLVARMCAPDPAARPTGAQVLAALMLEGMPDGLDGTRFVFRRHIDAGGMGEVLLVWDPVSQREVALKRVRAAMATPGVLFRFVEEARIAGQLQHPNILPVYELGEDALGMPFFTMKPVQGRNLSAVLRDLHAGLAPEWPLSRRLEVFLKLCDAVAYANGQDWLHLDLKPHNVLVGEFGEVYLVDWGLARRRPRAGHPSDPRPPGCTEAYAPPEQRERRVAELDVWSDVYALGVTLGEVVLGLGPTPGRRAESTAGSDPGAAPRATGPPAAPAELAAIVDRATRAAPGERYPNAAAVRADVERFLGGEPVSTYRYTARERFVRWSRPYQGPTAVAAVVLLAMGALGGAAWRSVDEARRSRVAEEQGASDLLVEQARAALGAGDRIEAERLAVRAVARAADAGLDSVTGRGLLSRIGRDVPPTVAGPCEDRGGTIHCALRSGDLAWTPGSDARSAASVGASADGRLWVDVDGARAESEPLPARVRATWACGRRVIARTDARTDQGAALWMWTPGSAVAALGSVDVDAAPRCDRSGGRLAVPAGERVDVWRLSPLRQETALHGHSDAIRALAWSDDGKRLATASADHTVRLWDADRWRRLDPLHSHEAELARVPGDASDLAFVSAAGGSTVLVLAGDPPRAWDVGGGDTVADVDALVTVGSIGWSGPNLASCDRHGNLRLWAANGLAAAPPIEGAAAFATDPDGGTAAVVDASGKLRLVDLADGRTRWVADASAVKVAWGRRWLATAGADGVATWNAADGAPVGRWAMRDRADLALDGDGDVALVRTRDGATRLVDLPAGPVRATWPSRTWVALDRTGAPRVLVQGGSLVVDRGSVTLDAPVRAVDLAPDGRTVAVATHDRTVRLFRASDGEELGRVAIDLGPSPIVRYSPDGRVLAVAGNGSTVELWDVSAVERSVGAFVDALGQRFAGIDLDLATMRGGP